MKKFIVLFLLIASVASAFNLSPFTYELRQRGAATNKTIVRNDSLITTDLTAILSLILRANDKVVTDTIQGIDGGDTTRILGTMWVDTARVSNRLYFAVADYNTYLDSALVDSIVQQLGRFAPGGAGTGDIEGVTAGSGLSGGGITGTVTVDVKPGWGLVIHDDSVKVNATDLQDSLTSSDSNAIVYEADRVGMYTDTGLYFGDIGDSTMLWYDLTSDNIKAYVTIFYGDDVADSAVATWGRITAAIGDSVAGLITGINSANGITGGASQGVATLQLDGSAFYVGGDTVRIFNNNAGRLILNVFGTPSDINEFVIAENAITFGSGVIVSGLTNSNLIIADGYREVQTADSAYPTVNRVNALIAASPAGDITNVGVTAPITGGGASGSVTIAFDWTWLYGFIDTTTAKIPTATLADSSVKYDTANAVNWTEMRQEIKNGAEIYNKIDTTTAVIPVATLSNSVLFSWLYTFVDTTTAVIPRATLADSCTKYDTTFVSFAELRTEIKNGAEIFNKIDTTTAKIPTASLADSAVKYDTSFVDWTELRAEIKNRAEIYNKIDTTSAKIPTASLADSAVKYDTSFVDWTELRTEIKNGAEIYNKIDTTSAVIPTATISNSVLFSWLYTFVDTTTATLPHATFADSTGKITHSAIKPWHLDTTASFVIGNLRTRARNDGVIKSNNFQVTDAESTLKIGGAQGLIIGSNIALGTDITDDTAIVTLPSEWAGGVLSRGYGDDSTKYWDSLTMRGGSDSYGNYIEFAKLTDTTSSALRRRHMQIAIPVPMDADTVYDVALSFRVFDGAGSESTYVRLKWSTTPFDSTNAYKIAYTERDSSASTTFDTLSAAYARTSVSRGSKIYALVTGLLYDKHVTWIRCYDIIMTYHRRYL